MVLQPTRFLIAKYVPDLRRGEPRNVGVVVWSPLGVSAKFLGEFPDRPGECHGSHIPDFVGAKSKSTYRQWVSYWHSRVLKQYIDPPNGGIRVFASDPLFLDVLRTSGKGNYFLVEGGIILDKVTDLSELTEHLFSTLVEAPAKIEEKDPRLNEVCDSLLERSKLTDDPYFVRNGKTISYETAQGDHARLKFHHAYVVDDHVEKLFQRVALSPMSQTQRNSSSTAWLFQEVVSANVVRREDAFSLVYVSEQDKSEPEVRAALGRLDQASTVINLFDEVNALRLFKQFSRVS